MCIHGDKNQQERDWVLQGKKTVNVEMKFVRFLAHNSGEKKTLDVNVNVNANVKVVTSNFINSIKGKSICYERYQIPHEPVVDELMLDYFFFLIALFSFEI